MRSLLGLQNSYLLCKITDTVNYFERIAYDYVLYHEPGKAPTKVAERERGRERERERERERVTEEVLLGYFVEGSSTNKLTSSTFSLSACSCFSSFMNKSFDCWASNYTTTPAIIRNSQTFSTSPSFVLVPSLSILRSFSAARSLLREPEIS